MPSRGLTPMDEDREHGFRQMKHILLTTIAAVLVVGCGPKAPDISIRDAAYDGNIEVVKQHLAAGTDVNGKVDDGWEWTPLHNAARNGHKEIIELLIAAGADVNAKDGTGRTPLDWAERGWLRDSPEVIAAKKETAALLRKHGGKTAKELEAELK